nr:MAG TPA: hypothetical protein [Caudoviricetes sp.]
MFELYIDILYLYITKEKHKITCVGYTLSETF